MFLHLRNSALLRMKSSWRATKSYSVNVLFPSGSSTKTTFERVLRLFSIRFSIMSLMLIISCSNFERPWWTWCKYPSMFIEVHVSVTIPGLSLHSKSYKCGMRRDLVFGRILFRILSYSLITN